MAFFIPSVVNPGFEAGLQGWNTTGVVESGGHTGSSHLTHKSGVIQTTQQLENLADGWYTLRVWLRTNAVPRVAAITLKDSSSQAKSISVPLSQEGWLQVAFSAYLTGGICTISLYSEIEDDGWIAFDDIQLTAGRCALPIRGADISSLKKSEDMGGIYYDKQGRADDALNILQHHGLNFARLRIWLSSPDGYHGKLQLMEMAKRFKALGIGLLVDFHYSDSWADPGKQFKPRAWENLDFEGLKKAVYEHTFDVCNALLLQGTPAEMVQVGNEINHGMLWPDGKNDDGFDRLAALLKEGVRAVRDSSPESLVMLHIAEGGDNKQFRWWFDTIIRHGVEFDLIGVSYYSYWHGTLLSLQQNLNDIALRYQKDIIVVETAYPFTLENDDATQNIFPSSDIDAFPALPVDGYPATPAGQKKMLADILSVIRAVPENRGLGFFWWDATWTAVEGNGWDTADPTLGNNWENQALFDFNDCPLPAMDLFKEP
ncbi:MAG: arabinogalactan endo-1,4-beta-galactosidase [Chloroflexi bacterium HGW-Chloroflexi-10]|nr:MAG: arabinogalactan endo-1,4-beta-galactosidase [Chloroflexi bacterium HGW-Chloroflexi-10]